MSSEVVSIAPLYRTGYTRVMKLVLKALGVISLWSIVIGIVIFVDPSLLRDILIPGLYLPFVFAVFVALGYTILVITHSFWLSLVVAALICLAIVLSIMQMLFWFVGLGIFVLLSVVCYIYFSQLK